MIPETSSVPHYHMSNYHIHVWECLDDACRVETETSCTGQHRVEAS